MTRKINDYVWKLCETCTRRNCRKTPKRIPTGFACPHRLTFQGGVKLIEVAMQNSPKEVVELLYDHGLKVEQDSNNNYKISRRNLKNGNERTN